VLRRFLRTATASLAILAAAAPARGSGPPPLTSPSHVFVRTEFASRVPAERLLNRFAVEIVLQHDYEEAGRSDAAWKTAGLPGLVDSRYFLKALPDGTRRTLELVSLVGPGGRFEIHLYGRDSTAGGTRANPDVAILGGEMKEIATGPASRIAEKEPAARSLGHRIYHLSYTQADRALAALKALGYATVEFHAEPGESVYDHLYDPAFGASTKLPLVVKLIDPPKTSLLDRDPGEPSGASSKGAASPSSDPHRTAVPDIGGTYLHQATAGEPMERLLIVYDENDPEPMEKLLNLLKEEIDVRARQVVISALVVEVNTDRLKDLGVSFEGGNGRASVSYGGQDSSTGSALPFTFSFANGMPSAAFTFTASLQALVQKGQADILSNPSVLVLDGRQARIQVGKQVPVVTSTSTAAGITSSVDYFPVGIVLNLRPRISDDGGEVTMQVETIVSAVAQTTSTTAAELVAPTIDNRQVQSFVRVHDNTPFIIGGLISSDNERTKSGVPVLSKIPLLGALFRRHKVTDQKREVIVVLTPHVVPLDDRSFSYVIPKDSDIFDSFGHELFRNAYRIRSTDVFDLSFVYRSDTLNDLVDRIRAREKSQPSLGRTEPFASLLRGEVPGEDILVRRMLWEIVRKMGYGKTIPPDHILVFEPDAAGSGIVVDFLDKALARLGPDQNAVWLSFSSSTHGTPEHPFVPPTASIRYDRIEKGEWEKRLLEENRLGPQGAPPNWNVLLSNDYTGSTSPLDVLRNVLVLKKVLELNSSLPLTIRDFSVGRQVIFPTPDDIARSIHVVDREAAKLFFEVKEYYPAFEHEFNRRTRGIIARLDEPAPAPPPQTVAPPPAPEPVAPPLAPRTGKPPAGSAVSPGQSPRERLDTLAARFRRERGSARYAIQVEFACRLESVESALGAGDGEVWFTPVRKGSEPCYRILWGRFATRTEAATAVPAVPARLSAGATPFVVELPAR